MTLAFMLDGNHAREGGEQDDMIYVGMNMHWEDHVFALPALPPSVYWHLFVDTHESAPKHIFEPGREPELKDQHYMVIGARYVVIIVGR